MNWLPAPRRRDALSAPDRRADRGSGSSCAPNPRIASLRSCAPDVVRRPACGANVDTTRRSGCRDSRLGSPACTLPKATAGSDVDVQLQSKNFFDLAHGQSRGWQADPPFRRGGCLPLCCPAPISLWKLFRRSRARFRGRPETVRLHRGIGVRLHPGNLFGIIPESRSFCPGFPNRQIRSDNTGQTATDADRWCRWS